MAYIKYNQDIIGKWAITRRKVKGSHGYFEKGTRVKVLEYDDDFGYFVLQDEEGYTIGRASYWWDFRMEEEKNMKQTCKMNLDLDPSGRGNLGGEEEE